ncbi:MAG: hypothetical protein ACD_73C00279G0002 [uncultured bacterium]|nr:MAG: hypothetical protein ACD_73C00279G0002 [uncultured bacterium]
MSSKTNKWVARAALVMLPFIFACSGSATSTSTDSDTETATAAFPSTLALSSPYSYEEAANASVSSSLIKAATSGGYVSSYVVATAEIEALLSATSAGSCSFDPEDFLATSDDADCYGPALPYENHPDSAGGTDDGELPPGDVGIWNETDATTGHACSAAELNAQMDGVSAKTKASLKGLASIICVINTNGLSMPSSSTLDVTAEMTALAIADTTFSGVTLSHEINADGNDQYTYNLDFTYTPGADPYDVVVEMDHVPGSTAGEYQGRLSYLVNSYMTGGNCPTRDITVNGSVLYESASLTALALQAREGSFCGHDSDGRTDSLVDPALKYDAASLTTGWGNNFSIFTAEFDPSSMEGNYSYTWQAGPQDNFTRTFNLNVNDSSEGVSFYGFGDDIEDTDGSVAGFICNWAGPNNDHTLQDYSQRQEMSFDSSLGLVVSDAADFIYAPTNTCDYDGTGTFTYDTDLDGVVDSDPLAVVANELLGLTDADVDGVFDEMAAAGFSLPVAPDNL